MVEYPLLLAHIVVRLGMREGGEHRELRQVQPDIKEKIYEPLDIILIMVVHAEQNRALNRDVVIMIALDPLPDEIGGIKNRLVHVPGAGPAGTIEHLGLILDGVAAPVFFKRNHLTEKFHLPVSVLGE